MVPVAEIGTTEVAFINEPDPMMGEGTKGLARW